MKKLSYILVAFVTAFILNAVTLHAQEVVLNEQFDSGEGQWSSGWIDPANATATFSIDTNSVLSGKNSYKGVITSAQMEMYRIQRVHDLPLVAGYVYTVSFMAVSDSADAGINVLFELAGSPYTQRLNDTASVTNSPKIFTYSMTATENVPTNQLKFMMGSSRNSGKTIWIDSIVVTRVADPTLVTQWGRTDDGFGAAWPILNDSSTAAGDAGIAGPQPMPSGTNGASLRGGFDTLQATMAQAVVITGQLQYVGGGMGTDYTPLRYALTFQDSSTLMYQYTDTAKWVSTKKHYGWEFTPRSSTGTQPNGGGGGGSVWSIINGNWASTYSNGGRPLGIVNQAPRNAEISEGTYNFAISVMQVSDSTNEIRWYIEKTDNSYWFGGTVIDTTVTTKFNGIAFWLKDGDATQFNVMGVRAELGSPITVPVAPWQGYYLDQWGLTNDGFSAAWAILNDSSYVDGNGSIAGPQPMPSGTNGAAIRGGFGQDVSIPTDKAVIVKGKIEYVGGGMGTSYTPLRYAITYLDSLTLQNQYTDSAKWVSTRTDSSQNHHYGYEFTPRSSTGVQPNGGGGGGSIWTVVNGNWASTYSNGGAPYGIVNQAPRNAEISAGTYDFAVSVQQVNDSTDEVRWYIQKQFAAGGQSTYWFGGTVWAPKVTDKFNGIAFWLKDGDATQFNVIDAYIDKGSPITVPVAPWQGYYLDQWGLTNDGFSAAWTILNDSSYVDGNGSIAGPQPMPSGTNGAAIRGGFGQDVSIPTDKAVIVKGQLEYVGGGMGTSYTPLRYAITYLDSLTLQNQYTDSAKWVSTRTNGSQNHHYGYEFTPRSSTGVQPNGGGGGGSIWTVVNGNWASTYSNGGAPYGIFDQHPRNAEISAGKYNFAVSVQQVNDTTDEVRWYIEKVHAAGAQATYWFGGTVWAPKVTDKFNGIAFWLKDGDATQFNVIDAYVDKGDPITLPQVPWQDFFIPTDQWGIYSSTGGWKLAQPDIDGNASISGSGPVASGQWASVRGGFGQTIKFSDLPPDTALAVIGKMEFVGGGFDGSSGLRLGLFYSDSAGTVDSTANGPMWSGSDMYSSGYLFSPNSGTNDNPSWAAAAGNKGSVGGVVNSSWYNTNGAQNYLLGNQKTTDVAGAGTYNFKLTFKDMGSQGTAVGYSISGTSYLLEGHLMDSSSSRSTKFNAVNFAVNGTNTSTTGLNLTDVQVVLGSPVITGVSNENSNALPMVYSLSQNYPNPFNPSTTIKFGLPKAGNVSLVVYDILGRKVTELVNGELTAGYHLINFNASDLASGVYFYRLQAGDFVSVKKLMLLK